MEFIVALSAVLALSQPNDDAIREAAVRASVEGEDPTYFVAHCISISPETVGFVSSREERIARVWDAAYPDASRSFLEKLADLPNSFRPASTCDRTQGDYEVIERRTRRGPALLSIFGPVEIIAADRVLILEFTTSGWLTETVTEYELQRSNAGAWRVTREEILLQV